AVGAAVVLIAAPTVAKRTHLTAYFDNSNGVFVGDDVLIRGVAVGKVDTIDPEPNRVKISFWVDTAYKIPRDAKAVVLSPTLVTARSIQLTPPYSGGPAMTDNAVIPQNRTAVPVEWDDFRDQLQKLTQTLQPTGPDGVSTLGQFVNTVADNLRGQAPNIRDSIIKLSQAISSLSDHSDDTFSSVKNLATLVSALHDSTDLMEQLNTNLAATSALLANDPDEVAKAVKDFGAAVTDVKTFIADNRDSLGMSTDKLASISTTLVNSLGDIKEVLHAAPTALANVVNVYQPAQGTISGAASVNNFRDPITFICGAIQAASRQNAEQSAKLCVQYLAPIVKNRQYNFLPIGLNPIVGASARPNEVTYSEDWMRPDHVPAPEVLPAPALPAAADPTASDAPAAPPNDSASPPLPAETGASPLPQTQRTDPGAGLPGMMLPTAGAPR
ncbi:MAG TPA: MCE family protein, partial [Mycobacterium sp.]|nr:MCE family protein [Mycobacterium sp.]